MIEQDAEKVIHNHLRHLGRLGADKRWHSGTERDQARQRDRQRKVIAKVNKARREKGVEK